ncbi:MAG: hypothetical protein M1286_01300 [Candidatus Marsarchaeota archaeon]|nr:hypothetical protein [Candidatus Marsarchaeota archaeon]
MNEVVLESNVKRGLLTKNGEEVERQVRDLFGLKRSKHPHSSKPDILDFTEGVVGEVKSFKKGSRVLLYVDQVRRYLELADEINATGSLDGMKTKTEPVYFVVVFDYENQKITDIYKLDREKLEKVLERQTKNQKWNIVNKRILRELRMLNDASQTLLEDAPRDELASDVLRGNPRGEYTRLNKAELDQLCPNVSDISDTPDTNHMTLHS